MKISLLEILFKNFGRMFEIFNIEDEIKLYNDHYNRILWCFCGLLLVQYQQFLILKLTPKRKFECS